MIKVFKNNTTPESLIRTSKYNGEDVKKQLIVDQHSKCYLCERIVVVDWQIDHFKSQKHNNTSLILDWNNLLLSCNYCNSKKLDHYDNLLNPITVDIENEIKQEIDLENKKALFTIISKNHTQQHRETINLLNLIFNGKNKIRKIREENFFEYVIGVYNRFKQSMVNHAISPTENTKRIILEELSINSELLGIKYWMIHSQPQFNTEFAKYTMWNKE